MTKNKTLGKYDIKYNNFDDDGVIYLTQVISEAATHVYEIEISERIKADTLKDFREKLALNKPKKGKKKKKKKKKK